MSGRSDGPIWPAGLMINVLIFGTVAFFLGLFLYDEDLFLLSVQEDGALEWATFWAFACGAVACVVAGVRYRRVTGRLPWFLFGLGLFSFLAGMEEISWGQRLLGYRPPPYFLENNAQLELNVHNAFGGTVRQVVFRTLVGGFGILLPLTGFLFARERFLERLGVVAPPLALLPGFLLLLVGDVLTVVDFDREIFEFLLGAGILFAAIYALREFAPPGRGGRLGATILLAFVAVLALGGTTAVLLRERSEVHPEDLEAARIELEAMQQDFLAQGGRTICGLHTRLSTYEKHFGLSFLREGAYAALAARGLAAERSDFFLDPWEMPYWVRDNCLKDGSRRRVEVYSFGPNRRRDSPEMGIAGDDLGATIYDGVAPGGPSQDTP